MISPFLICFMVIFLEENKEPFDLVFRLKYQNT